MNEEIITFYFSRKHNAVSIMSMLKDILLNQNSILRDLPKTYSSEFQPYTINEKYNSSEFPEDETDFSFNYNGRLIRIRAKSCITIYDCLQSEKSSPSRLAFIEAGNMCCENSDTPVIGFGDKELGRIQSGSADLIQLTKRYVQENGGSYTDNEAWEKFLGDFPCNVMLITNGENWTSHVSSLDIPALKDRILIIKNPAQSSRGTYTYENIPINNYPSFFTILNKNNIQEILGIDISEQNQDVNIGYVQTVLDLLACILYPEVCMPERIRKSPVSQTHVNLPMNPLP